MAPLLSSSSLSSSLRVLRGYSVGPRRLRCGPSSGPLRVLGGNLVPRVSLLPAPKSGKKRDAGNEVAEAGPLWVLGRYSAGPLKVLCACEAGPKLATLWLLCRCSNGPVGHCNICQDAFQESRESTSRTIKQGLESQ